MRVSPRLAPRGTPKGGGQRRSPESPKIAVAVVRKRTYSCWCHMCLNVAAVSQSAPQAAHLSGRGGARSVRRTAPEVHGAGASPGRMAETAQLLPLISKHRAAGPPGAGRGSSCCTRRGARQGAPKARTRRAVFVAGGPPFRAMGAKGAKRGAPWAPRAPKAVRHGRQGRHKVRAMAVPWAPTAPKGVRHGRQGPPAFRPLRVCND